MGFDDAPAPTIARLAVGGAVAGAAYHAGEGRAQDAVNEQATEAYDATQAAPSTPPTTTTCASSPPSSVTRTGRSAAGCTG